MLYTDIVAQEDFLGSHVLRIPITTGPTNGKEEANVRDNRGKAKQVTTFNGRTVIIKENSIYSNKGDMVLEEIRGLIALISNYQASSLLPKLSFCPMPSSTLRRANPGHGSYTTFRVR